MIKKISPGFAQQVDDIKSDVAAEYQDFLDAVESFNDALRAEWDNLQASYQTYQEALVNAANAVTEISQEIADEADTHDAGTPEHKMLTNWADDWELAAEDLQLAAETDLEEILDCPESLSGDDALDPTEILDSAPLVPDQV